MKPQALLEFMHPIFPADFFCCHVDVFVKETVLPDLSIHLAQESFARVSLSWSEDSLKGTVLVKDPLGDSFFPDYQKGDAIEIFIDTRDNKKAGFASKFCHQFVFFPKEIEGSYGREITKFRSEDSHPLCDASLLSVKVELSKESYLLTFTLSKEELYGYDPTELTKLGFAYRIYRGKGKEQCFPFSAKSFDPLQNPSLWASLSLK